jgi:hypothetical protein
MHPAFATTSAFLIILAASGPYLGGPEIDRGDAGGAVISGHVFEDRDRDAERDAGEAGIEGVLVSNGRDWTETDAEGRYEIAVREDMNLTIVQPAGWRVPTDRRRVPQFFYVHKPEGSPDPLRYGGLDATGPAPERVDFPLIRRQSADDDFRCAVVGDTQTYANQEIGWLRDGPITDLAEADLDESDCMLYVGDVVGDDLGLLDRLLQVGATVGPSQWLVHGNHDFDFDAKSDADSADSWRRIVGPNYYAFEQGAVVFVVLDNVIYPCGEHQADRRHDFCDDSDRATYNGRVDAVQMQWLEGLLARTPEERLIVIATHIPLVSFADADSAKHQTDNADRLHRMLAGRRVLSLAGHTHTIENHAPGQHFEGWQDNTGVGPLPFRHIVAGAGSGAWYQGDFNIHGNPMALQRLGAPNGVLLLDFEGNDYRERYLGARLDPDRGQWIGLNTPAFRDWYQAIMAWREQDRDERDPLPPYSINDLPDTGLLTPADLEAGTWLTANVWAGSAETEVTATLSNGIELKLERTQAGDGEAPRQGAVWADPFAVQRQLSVGRWALESRHGDLRAQGFELFQGNRYWPAPPQPQGSVADRNMHLWRVRLPADLGEGVYSARVVSTDRNGTRFADTLIFEVRAERPPRYFRGELWPQD